MNRIVGCSLLASSIVSSTALAQGDPAVVAKIIDEGKNHSQVWKHLEHLAHEIGPRLTGSSGLIEANAWTRDQFAAFGLSNAHLFKWGEVPVAFDRGISKCRMIKPVEQDFEFTTRSWSAGTNGPVSGPVVKQPTSLEELEAMKDKLKGAWVVGKSRPRNNRRGVVAEGAAPDVEDQITKAMYEAGILGRLMSARGDLVVTGGERNWREMDFKKLPTEVNITIRRADYDALNSRIADGEEVTVEADLQHHFVEGPFPLYNTVAEIKGTQWPEQVIIVSGHLDSWDGPGSQGAQDNGTGSAVTLETARILMAAGVKPKRTIRFCLWTGEEQGLLGSAAYLKSLTDQEKANISAVFVDDGGTNYQGGLVMVKEMEPMLRAATAAVTAAFPDMPVEMRVEERMPRGGGSDHSTFNRAGIPGFFWDESGSGGREGKDYNFVHHTQHDTTRYAVPEYLVQSATCSAVTVYNLAMADTILPRYVAPPEPEIPADDPNFTPTEGPLTGTWSVTMGEREYNMILEHGADGKMRGRTESERGTSRLVNLAFDAATGDLTGEMVNENFGSMKLKTKVSGEEMEGTMNRGADFNTPFKAKRTSKTAPPPPPPPPPTPPVASSDAPGTPATGGASAQGRGAGNGAGGEQPAVPRADGN